MAPFESLSTVSYSHFVATLAVSLAVCEIFNYEDWRDLENWVRICSRLLKMVPFERLGTISYSPCTVTMALSCIIAELKREKLVENHEVFIPPCIRRPR